MRQSIGAFPTSARSILREIGHQNVKTGLRPRSDGNPVLKDKKAPRRGPWAFNVA
jgi:hypothetical protein